MQKRKEFAIYTITKHGLVSALRLQENLKDSDVYVSEKLLNLAPKDAKKMSLPMGPTLSQTFAAYNCHIFIISVGAVVRMIKDLIVDKKTDPAVICVDDDSRFAICLLSGHIGRGNDFTKKVADVLGAIPVITTASDVRGTLTVDILGRELGWTLDDPNRNITKGCASVVNENQTLLIQETGEPHFWPLDKRLPPGLSYSVSLEGIDPTVYETLLIISDLDIKKTHPHLWDRSVIYRPKSLALGLGCDRDTPPEIIERGVQYLLQKHHLSIQSVKFIASIDKKHDEKGFRELSHKYKWPFHTYSASKLDSVSGIQNPSEMVRKYVGTRSVAEAASLLASGAKNLTVAKETYKEEGDRHNMTLSVARIPFAKRKIF